YIACRAHRIASPGPRSQRCTAAARADPESVGVPPQRDSDRRAGGGMKRATLLAAALFAMPFANATEGGEETLRLEAGPGAQLVTGRCIVCHSVDYIEMNAPVLDRA